jgi:hypothetical protein
MKTLTVNVQMQFDSFDEGADQHTALDMIDKMNEVLQQRFPDASPIIFTNAIDDDDIEIRDADVEDQVEF